MCVKLLFEDSPGQPISDLLKASMNGENIEFSKSYSNLFKKAIELIDNGASAVIIFRDFPIDNKIACQDYTFLRTSINQRNVDSGTILPIYVVPIICSEYIMCKMILRYGYLFPSEDFKKRLLDCTVKSFDYLKAHELVMGGPIEEFLTPDKIPKGKSLSSAELERLATKHRKKAIKSTEKLFKYILRHFKQQACLSAKANSGDSKFYRENCNCKIECSNCEIKCTDALSLKAERLYTSLPIFTLSEEHQEHLKNLSVDYEKINLKELKDDLENFYNNMYNNILQSGLKLETELDEPIIDWPDYE